MAHRTTPALVRACYGAFARHDVIEFNESALDHGTDRIATDLPTSPSNMFDEHRLRAIARPHHEARAVTDTPLPAPARPVDPTPRHTGDLPATPTRDRTIPASAWLEAPDELLVLGARFGGPNGLAEASVAGHEASFLRRVGPWLLWRAGPARGGEACLWAVNAGDLARSLTFRLHADGTGEGVGPSGETRRSFRAWKEDLRDHT